MKNFTASDFSIKGSGKEIDGKDKDDSLPKEDKRKPKSTDNPSEDGSDIRRDAAADSQIRRMVVDKNKNFVGKSGKVITSGRLFGNRGIRNEKNLLSLEELESRVSDSELLQPSIPCVGSVFTEFVEDEFLMIGKARVEGSKIFVKLTESPVGGSLVILFGNAS